MKLFRTLAVAAVGLAFVIAVLGSWVRINDAGLTCPDWPLCRGALVPALAGGVELEWSHRAIAFLESFVVAGAIVAGLRMRRRIAGVTTTLIALGIIFTLQISLGGATVLLANSPLSVMLHWGMGMALLATLTVLAVLALLAPPSGQRFGRDDSGATPVLTLAAAFAFATMCIGAYVSSSGAGVACPTIPACYGTPLGTDSAQLAQMLHRWAALAFAIVTVFAAAIVLGGGASLRTRAFALAGLGLVAAQIVLGVLNVVWHLPTALREAHAANAAAAFIAFVVAAVLARLDPFGASAPAREPARAPQRIARSA